MIISHGRRYIFVHAPKTGGTSMALALEARAMKDDIMLGDTPKALRRRRRLKDAKARGRLWKHSTLADIEGLVDRQAVGEFFVFTLVRNPWDRMVSYYHWLQGQSFDHPAVSLAQQLEFGAFVASAQVQASLRQNPARSYVSDGAGVEHCDLFVRLEHIETDIRPLEAHLGFPVALERVNTSQRKADYREYYDTAARAAIETACAEDIERFGYTFDPGKNA